MSRVWGQTLHRVTQQRGKGQEAQTETQGEYEEKLPHCGGDRALGHAAQRGRGVCCSADIQKSAHDTLQPALREPALAGGLDLISKIPSSPNYPVTAREMLVLQE